MQALADIKTICSSLLAEVAAAHQESAERAAAVEDLRQKAEQAAAIVDLQRNAQLKAAVAAAELQHAKVIKECCHPGASSIDQTGLAHAVKY